MSNATDIISLAEAKRYLSMDQADETKDAELQTYITGVSSALDGYSGPVVQRTITNELHDGGAWVIFLREFPVVSVTTVTNYQGATVTVLTADVLGSAANADGYQCDANTGMLWRRRNGVDYLFTADRRNVKVTYVAGRYADTASVAQPYKLAACLSLADAWRSTIGGGNVAYGNYNEDARVTYAVPYQAQAYVDRRPPRVA